MANPFEPIEKWVTGPPGFKEKANRQLAAIDARTAVAPGSPQQVRGTPFLEPVLAKITGSSSAGDNRWEYDLIEVRRSSGTIENHPSGRTFIGYNGAEDPNTSSNVGGVALSGDGYTLTAAAIPNGTVVSGWLYTDVGTNTQYLAFYAANPLTPACEE